MYYVSQSRSACQDWDVKYIEALNSRPHKCILTGFPPHYGFDESYQTYTDRKHNTYNVPINISNCFEINSKGVSNEMDFKETAVVSAANIFSTGEFTQITLYDEYLHPFREQEIICCLAFQYGYKVEVMREALIWHCYYNNLPGSDEKYRTLPGEEISITGFEYCFVPLLDKRNTPYSATQWTEHILKFKQ